MKIEKGIYLARDETGIPLLFTMNQWSNFYRSMKNWLCFIVLFIFFFVYVVKDCHDCKRIILWVSYISVFVLESLSYVYVAEYDTDNYCVFFHLCVYVCPGLR